MQRQLFALSLGFVGLILATHHAFGQTAPQCAERTSVLAQLAGTWGEARRGIGIAANAAVVELFASDETGTWTITATLPDGRTCLLASGDNYESLNDPLPVPGEGA